MDHPHPTLDPEGAAEQLSEHLGRELLRARWEPWDEELETSALEGKLSSDEQQAFDALLECDPVLAAEFEALSREGSRSRLPSAFQGASLRWGWAAALAILVLGASTLWWAGSKTAPAPARQVRAEVDPSLAGAIFVDSFESGSTGAWVQP